MLKATILALVVAHAAAYNAAPLVGRGAVRAAASRRPALAVMHHGVGDHPEPAAPLAAEPAPQQKFRVLPMALGAVAGAIAIRTVLLPTAAVAAGAAATVAPVSLSEVMAKASKRALGGGLSGAIAGVCQVVLLMWLRTTMNYQYRNGGTRKEAMAALYKEGGMARFYKGSSSWIAYALRPAIEITIYDQIRNALLSEPGATIGGEKAFLLGALGRAIGTAVVFPVTFAMKSVATGKYKTLTEAWATAIRGRGVLALWSGLGPELPRGIAMNATMMATREVLAPYNARWFA